MYVGQRFEAGAERKAEDRARETRDIALEATAQEIAKISVKNTTIRQQAEKEIIREPQYIDPKCEQSDAVFKLLLDAYKVQQPVSASDGKVRPDASAPAGQVTGSNNDGAVRSGESLF
jgi:hypothetical protein